MARRWAKPKSPSPQQRLALVNPRYRFMPATKPATDTSVAAAESVGIRLDADEAEQVGKLAGAMVGVLRRHTARVRLGGVMLALTVRRDVLNYLGEHPEGATADEIAYALKNHILTVRPRVSELRKLGLIKDSGARRENASGRNAIVWVKG